MKSPHIKTLGLFVLLFFCFSAAVILPLGTAFSEECAVLPGTPLPRGASREYQIMGASSGDPTLYCSVKQEIVNRDFFLSWDESGSVSCVLFVSFNGGDFESLGQVGAVNGAYAQNKSEPGEYAYVLMTCGNDGVWRQSNTIYIQIFEEGKTIRNDPVLFSSQKGAAVNRDFYLSWDEGGSVSCVLFVSFSGGDFVSLGQVDAVNGACVQNKSEPGEYAYVLMICSNDGVWRQSNIVYIQVFPGNEPVSEDPVLYVSGTEVNAGRDYYLSWNESGASSCMLFRSFNDGPMEKIADVDAGSDGYVQNQTAIGKYTYILMTVRVGGDWKESNPVDVWVTADENTVCSQLAARGYDNRWNLLFIVYRNLILNDFESSFSDAEIGEIRSGAALIGSVMENLSDGRMQIGSVDVLVVDEPVTSVSDVGYLLPGLSYGPDGDVDFNYIFDHKDISLVGVFLPILGYHGGDDWLGLGGTVITAGGRRIYNVIFSAVELAQENWSIDGKTYPVRVAAWVHEMLHAVETNSRTFGWNQFQLLHDYAQNGYENTYENGNFPWYHDLMRNELKNGEKGFLRYSFYIRHASVPDGMSYGIHTDYDHVTRCYIDGLPHAVDLVIPASVEAIEAEAFAGIRGKRIYIPDTVRYIDPTAFSPGITVYGYPGSAAETWSKNNGHAFIRVR